LGVACAISRLQAHVWAAKQVIESLQAPQNDKKRRDPLVPEDRRIPHADGGWANLRHSEMAPD